MHVCILINYLFPIYVFFTFFIASTGLKLTNDNPTTQVIE